VGRRLQLTGLDKSVLKERKEKSIKTFNNILRKKIGYIYIYIFIMIIQAGICVRIRRKGIHVN
jgi:hypothetical protein